MATMSPDFLAFSDIEEQILSSKLDGIRKVLEHSGEKGRSLEAEMVAWLRSFLPTESPPLSPPLKPNTKCQPRHDASVSPTSRLDIGEVEQECGGETELLIPS